MQMSESLAGAPEGLSETSCEATEFICSTEIGGFEGCELINNEQLAGYLKETLPPSHFEGCPSIEFDPSHPLFIQSPYTLGFYECDSHAIHVGDESRFSEGAEGMKDTIIHEVGHNVQSNFAEDNPEFDEAWARLHVESWQTYMNEGIGFVSNYATTDMYEDFAESYKTYVRDPELLEFHSPEKYEFLRNNVFSAREYL
ncbi:MAG: putative zinc-binding metallopeptidase [Thermosynechococcaceae cyanobacterium]